MANPQIDRLSDLPDALLSTILSFLPTHIAARTSALCHRFRYLWEASPSLALISRALPQPQTDNFIAMANRALLSRNPSHPLLSLHLDVSPCVQNASFLLSLLAKARSLDLRHLTIDFNFSNYLPILPIIFTIKSLTFLSLDRLFVFGNFQEFNFTSGITLNCLRSLSLGFFGADTTKLNPLLSQLSSLEDLHLDISGMSGLNLSSKTIKKLKLIITLSYRKLDAVLSFPSLESLHLETQHGLQSLSHIHGEVPLLRKAVIKLHDIHERDVSAVAGLLNWISHVEELNLHIKESPYAIPILLESEKDVPKFSNLKHLDVTLCFHEHNLAAFIMMLHNCPVLKSLKLVHENRKRKDWGSKLPRNADGNYRYAYFRNLHLEEDHKEFMKFLSKKCTSKRQARK
ncbi:F-box/FBD/LRR-repeat protein At5g22700-like isoform X2 [Carex rostrata]